MFCIALFPAIFPKISGDLLACNMSLQLNFCQCSRWRVTMLPLIIDMRLSLGKEVRV